MSTEVQTGHRDDRRVFKLEDGETHWIVAETADEALRIQAIDSCGYESVEEYIEDIGGVELEVCFWSFRITLVDDAGDTHKKQAWEWALSEKGIFCSTVV